jgi:coproporphyrinogen III oxidase-like Fe-S oxidoreductase
MAIYKSISLNNDGTVGVGKYLTGILDAVSYALGSVNNFAKYVEDNKAVIIDTAYTEITSDTKKANKFTLNLAGTNSIVRNHQIKSKIFPNQATMIAIGAGAGSNLGSVQASTYNYMNEGITSRLYYKMSDSPTKNTEESDKARIKKIYEENIYSNLKNMTTLYITGGEPTLIKKNFELLQKLIDEGYSYRPPTMIKLNKGWNKVLIKSPVGSFKSHDWQTPVKWMFTFLPVK